MIFLRAIPVTLLICCLHVLSCRAMDTPVIETKPQLTPEEQYRYYKNTTLTGIGVITVWGILNWDYFAQSPQAQSEDWFGRNTENGGADKLGHLYTTYAFSHGLSKLYKYWGMEQEQASLYGAISSFAMMSYMEIGDAFSNYGFSYEDFISNGIGALLGYWLDNNPRYQSLIDLRWEYGIDPNKLDFATDYENSKYLIAVKLSGIEAAKRSWLRYLELHIGYYTRGYEDEHDEKQRNLYVGIGFNLSNLLYQRGWKKTGTVLRYIQPPYMTITHDM